MTSSALLYIFIPPLVNAILSLFSWPKKYLFIKNVIFFFIASLSFSIVMRLMIISQAFNFEIDYDIGSLGSNIMYSLSVSRYGFIFAFILSLIYPFAIVYTLNYLQTDKRENDKEFLFFYNLTVFAAFGVAFSGNLIMMLTFYELITAASYPLILYSKDEKSVISSRYYLTYLIGSSVLLLLPAITQVYQLTGTVAFIDGGIPAMASIGRTQVNIIMILFILGLAKTAIFPMSSWIIKAMVAPAPVSSLLHSLVVVKSGLFALCIVSYKIFGFELLKNQLYSINGINALTIISAFTIFYSASKAIACSNLKKRFAYSTINQIALAILLLSTFSIAGLRASMVQFMSHSVAKFALFSAIGALKIMNNNYDIENTQGIWKKSPITAITTLLSCLSLIGLPPTIGFYAKYKMIDSAFASGNTTVVLILALSTALSFSYTFDLIYQIFFFRPNKNSNDSKTISRAIPAGIELTLLMLSLLMITSIIPFDLISRALTLKV